MKNEVKRRSDASELGKSVTQGDTEEGAPALLTFDQAAQDNGHKTSEALEKVTAADDWWGAEAASESGGVCLLIA